MDHRISAAVLLAALAVSCSRRAAPEAFAAGVKEPTTTAPPRWPRAGALLRAPLDVAPRDAPARRWRIYLDAGHGAKGNAGTQSVTCGTEEDFTLQIANDLAERLPALGPFDIRVSRDGSRPVSYPARIQASVAWNADAFVAIHMDARGSPQPWNPTPDRTCWRQDESPGFSVLWSSEGKVASTARRHALAQALAARMQEAGFLAYDGVDYLGHYVADPEREGVFENRAGIGRRIFLLRKPAMPAVIIETHHALDLDESTRWQEPRTLEAFAAAVAAGLVDALDPPEK